MDVATHGVLQFHIANRSRSRPYLLRHVAAAFCRFAHRPLGRSAAPNLAAEISFSPSLVPRAWYCIRDPRLSLLYSCPHLVYRGRGTVDPAPTTVMESAALEGTPMAMTRQNHRNRLRAERCSSGSRRKTALM